MIRKKKKKEKEEIRQASKRAKHEARRTRIIGKEFVDMIDSNFQLSRREKNERKERVRGGIRQTEGENSWIQDKKKERITITCLCGRVPIVAPCQ